MSGPFLIFSQNMLDLYCGFAFWPLVFSAKALNPFYAFRTQFKLVING
ncbi:hypothetical protein P872_08360 [Rhodonellum psychrophilum GCM71 = DSM 17998]|uniref:Uncharacterized protein n=2 Tax=Rhodonellum TaxID=336827 RepID=U5C1M6_9BACT|nr:hypothetical protein P872_08360 [Rhodonellum psychrophilum GCM71 = DSM 17998]SDZ17199.1 hypothetical protein SAMN05444412_10718 [Rhodonellum ikkaensis]